VILYSHCSYPPFTDVASWHLYAYILLDCSVKLCGSVKRQVRTRRVGCRNLVGVACAVCLHLYLFSEESFLLLYSLKRRLCFNICRLSVTDAGASLRRGGCITLSCGERTGGMKDDEPWRVPVSLNRRLASALFLPLCCVSSRQLAPL